MIDKEIEFKYWADFSKEVFFQRIKKVFPEVGEKYVVSCDDYFLDSSGDFIRFRKSHGFFELTVKRKEEENVVRQEVNVDISKNNTSSVLSFLNLLGYKKSFQVYKEAWIWHAEDCDISYYTLADGRSVVELEATEYNSIKQGVSIIKNWEAKLDLKKAKKESRSLFEIYSEELCAKEKNN
jgi:adenylate cyclase class IV